MVLIFRLGYIIGGGWGEVYKHNPRSERSAMPIARAPSDRRVDPSTAGIVNLIRFTNVDWPIRTLKSCYRLLHIVYSYLRQRFINK